jgi:hypothetical protein
MELFVAWKEAGALAEIHIFQVGQHGFGMDQRGIPVDSWIAWDIRSRAVLQSERQTANGGAVYNYLFDWKTPLYEGRPRAYHNSDLAFWFNNTDAMGYHYWRR